MFYAYHRCNLGISTAPSRCSIAQDAIFNVSNGIVEITARCVSHAATKAQHQVKGGLLLDVVVLQRATILELLAREDETLLVRRDALLVLNLRLHCLDGVCALHLQCDRLSCECLHKDLHAATKAQH